MSRGVVRRPLAVVLLYSLLVQSILSAAPLTARAAAAPASLATGAMAAADELPPAVHDDGSVVLHEVMSDAAGVAAIDHDVSSNTLLLATESDTAGAALVTVDTTGARRTFAKLNAIAQPVVAASRATGEVFVAGRGTSTIARIAARGTSIVDPWATIPSAAIAELHVDAGGAWGGDLIAVTTDGVVWRVAMDGQVTRVAGTGAAPAGVVALPVDEGRRGPWSGAIVVGARDSATVHAIDAAGVVTPYSIGVVPHDLALVAAHENFFGADRTAGAIRAARADAFAAIAGDLVVAQQAPGVLARVSWDGAGFVTTTVGEAARWDAIAFSPAGVGAVPPARRIYDAIAVVRHAPQLTGGRIEGALWQLSAENVLLDGTDTITSDLLVPGTPTVTTGSGKPSFGGVIQGSDSAEPSGYTIRIEGNAALRHVINRTDPMVLPAIIPPPAAAGTRDVALTKEGETAGDFATLRNLSLSGKAGEVAVPPGTYGHFTATGRTTFLFGSAGATAAAVYNLEHLDLSGGAELRVAGPTVINLRSGATITGASAGAANEPGRLILNVAGGDVEVLGTGVLAALVRVPQGSVKIDGNGVVRGTVGADRLSIAGNGELQVTQTDVPPPQVNRPPSVSAGADQTITLPDDTLRLEGSITDDGLPRGSSPSAAWSVVEGAGVVFGDRNAAVTTATFATPGNYVLRLTADDSALRTSDDVTITVIPENHPPEVSAGADQRIELPSQASLGATVTDDGLPAGSTLAIAWSKVAGPGDVTFEQPASAATRASFSAAGVYTLRVTATDGEDSAFDELAITVDPENQPPVVDAGEDQFIVIPSAATLSGTASDDGWPYGSTLTTKWTKFSGPGSVAFGDAARPATTATFALAGTYVLRLSATDGRETRFDDVTITVDPINEAPVVSAGADATIELPNAATLGGTVSDDGWPRGSTVTQQWSVVSGTGVAFADASAASTTATFTAPGEYVLRLTATDGEASASAEVTITVDPENQPPSVDAGADAIIVLPNVAALRGTASDDGWPRGSTLATAWTKISGAGGVTFADATQKETTAAFALAGTYVLRLSATDGRETRFDDVTITVDPINEAPVVSAGADATIELPNPATLGGTVSDDGWPRGSTVTQQWSVVSGTGVAFADASAASTTATFTAPGEYVLRLTATDGEASASADVTITVDPENQPPAVDAGADAIIVLPNVAALRGTASDDGWPRGSTLATAWTKVSGAGDVTFADATQKETTAAFALAGTYVLRLSATDGRETRFDDVTVTVDPINEAPVVSAGADAAIELPNAATLGGTVSDDGWPRGSTVTQQWSVVSGSGVAFADASAASTTATFTTPGEYVLRLTATDGEASASADVTITVDPENQPPAVSAGADATIELPNAATLGGTVSDDGWPRGSTVTQQWSVVSGSGVTFGDAHAASTTAAFSSAGTYVLRLTATDGAKTASDDVTITVTPENRAPVVDAGSDQAIRLPAVANLSGAATDDGIPAGAALAAQWIQVSGPGVTAFADAAALQTTASFSNAGTYVLRLTVSDTRAEASDDVIVVVGAANVAPTVDAGADQTIELPSQAQLQGVVTDDEPVDGQPLIVLWQKVSGPGEVTFADAASPTTAAAFTVAGTYVLALTANDSQLSASDEITIVVLTGNRAPVVSAGADQTIHLPNAATLTGSATDDGKPSAQLTYAWSVVSGGDVQFANASAPETTATFAAPGAYVLRLSVSDGDLAAFDDVAITVVKANEPPRVHAGADQTISGSRTATLNGTVEDDGLPTSNVTTAWSFVSGPGPVAFSDAATPSTVATFARAGVYVLRLTADDGALSAFDDVHVAVSNVPTAAITVPGLTRNAAVVANNAASFRRASEVIAFSSETPTANLARFIIDDHPGTRWRSASGLVTDQFITIRLGGASMPVIDRFRLLNGDSTEAVRRFRIEASTTTADESAFTTIVEGELLQGTRYQEFVLPQPVTARYLRFVAVTGWGTTALSLTELYAIDPNESGIRSFFNPETIGLAHEGTAAVEWSPGSSAGSVNDGNPNTPWMSSSGSTNHYITLRLPSTLTIDRLRLTNLVDNYATWGVRDFRVDVSTTDTSATSFRTVFTGTAAMGGGQQTFTFPAAEARYVKLFILNSHGGSRVGVADFVPIVAAREPATVSSYLTAGYSPDSVFDDNPNTRWTTYAYQSIDQYFVYSLTPGEPALVESFVVDAGGSDAVKDFEILVSDTTAEPSAFRSVVAATFKPSGVPVRYAIAGGAVRARYVKFLARNGYGPASYGVSVHTFEVHTVESEGNIVSAPVPSPRIRNMSPAQIANGAAVVSASGSSAPLMLDYVLSPPWSTSEAQKWATIELGGGRTHMLSGVRIGPRMDNTTSLDSVKDFEVWVSSTTTDDAAFTKVLTASAPRSPLTLHPFLFPGGAVEARYVKYVPLTNHSGGSLAAVATGYFDVILASHDGGVIAASTHWGANLPEGVLDNHAGTNWVTYSGAVTNQWIKMGFEGDRVRELYGVTIIPYSWSPIDFEIRVSTTTTDDSAFTTVYTGKYDSSRTEYWFGRSYPAKYVQFFFKNSTSTTFIGFAQLNTYTVPEDGGAMIGVSSAQRHTPVSPSLLIDVGGRSGTWEALGSTNESATVALPYGRAWLVDQVMLQARLDCCPNYTPREFEVQVSATDSAPASFVTVYSGVMRPWTRPQHFRFDAVPARFVRVVAKNHWGASWIALHKFHVFSPEIGSMNALFTDASVAPGAQIVDWRWSFGDGGTSGERDPRHQYAAAGTYDVELGVTDSNGVSTSTKVRYRADGPPSVDFTVPTDAIEGKYSRFVDQAVSNVGLISSRLWDFGDGTTATATSDTTAKFYYDNSTYPTTLTVANARGIRASITKDVPVANAAPIANAGPDVTIRWGDPWTPASKATDPGVRDLSTLVCRWDYSDGTSATAPVPCTDSSSRVPHVFPGAGVFEATLVVSDKDGAVSSGTVIVSASGQRSTNINYAGDGGATPGEPIAVGAMLRDFDNGQPIAGRTIVFEVGTHSVSAVTSAEGLATATIPHDGTSDSVTVNMRFDGDALYLASTASKTLRCPKLQQPLDVAFLFDASGSMDKALPIARRASIEMIDEMQDHDQIAVVRFADSADVVQTLTLDHAAAAAAMEKVQIFGGTDLYDGVEGTRIELSSVRRNPMALPVMIVLSDGESQTNPDLAGTKAKQAGIRIVSIYMQPPSGLVKYAYDYMARLASSPSDLYVATKPEDLAGLYETIFGTLCTAANKPPLVDAGPDQNIMLPAMTASLSGNVVDDGLPPGSALTTAWTLVSGPGTATFANAAAKATTATFSAAGTYVLELSASDTQYTGTDTITIRIADNTAPAVDAGADQSIMLPANSVTLSGTITDDGLPPDAALTSTWTMSDGPGNVTFANAASASTTATFDAAGVYTLTLTASDSLLTASDTVVITVAPANQPPVVSAGEDQSLSIGANLLINGSNDDALIDGAIHGWTAVSGTWKRATDRALRGEASFASDDASAELRQDVDVSAFAQSIDAGTQQFVWSAFARTLNETPADTADAIVEYRDAANARVLLGRGVEITAAGDWLEGSETNTAPAGTRWIRVRLLVTRNSGTTTDVALDAVSLRALGAAGTKLAGSVTDDGAPAPVTTTWSSVASSTDVSLLDASAVDTPAAFSAPGDYTLRLTATDTAATSTDDVAIAVAAANPRPNVNAGADAEVTLPETATLVAIVTDDDSVTTRWEQTAGPAAATIADAANTTTAVSFTTGGTYRFRIVADDGDELALDSVLITVKSPGQNTAPVVDAGADLTINAPDTSATLNATVTDDGLPTGSSVTTTWSQVSGPGTATFADAASRTTTVTFSSHGIYVLRLTATDGELTAADDLTVRYDGTNQPPVVNAGADQTVKINVGATLAATVTDDNLPLGATVSLNWTKVSGPGDVTFTPADAATTSVAFSATGTYVVNLTASDSALSAGDDVTIVVDPALPPPVVEITSPEGGSTITDRTVFSGTVSEGAEWRLEYRLNPVDETAGGNPWSVIATGTGPVNGPLGTFDPTVLLNGTYKVRLVAQTPDGRSDNMFITTIVDGDLKVGLFRLSFTDAGIDMPGLPIEVSRTYDSRDKRVGDFGVGWNVSVLSARVEKSGVLGTGWEETATGTFTSKTYCLRPVLPRFVTITLGNDKVFRFRMKSVPECQSIAAIDTAEIVFEALRGTYGTLEVMGDNQVYVSGSKPGPVELLTMDGAIFNPSRFRLRLADGVVVEIDEQRGIEKMIDRHGNTLTFTAGGIQHSAGRSVTFTRDALGRIAELTDAANKKVVYTYDSRGDLVKVTDQAGLVTQFVYNSTHGLVEYFDAAGRKGFTSEYDASGRLIAVVDGSGNRTVMNFDPSLRRQVMTDAEGHVTYFDYDARGNLVATGNASGQTSASTYDDVGNRLTHTDAIGRTTTFTYDAAGNVLTVTNHAGYTTTYTYNAFNQATSVTDARGHKTTHEYDDEGNEISVTDPTGKKTVHTYNDRGQLLTTTDPDSRTRSFAYHADGQLKSETDTRGHVTSYTYDAMGRMTKSVDPKGGETTFVYDDAGKLLTETAPGGLVTRNEYASSGALLAITSPEGVRTQAESNTRELPTVTTYADGTKHELEYDGNDQLKKSTQTGGVSASVTYTATAFPESVTFTPDVKIAMTADAEGRLAASTDPRNQTTTYTYNVFDDLATETNTLGEKTEYGHDAVGNVTSVIENGHPVATFEYDEADRRKSSTDGEGRKSSLEYNWRGDVTKRINGKGDAISYSYDGEGNLETVVEPGGGVTSIEYDGNGNKRAVADAAAQRTTYVHDEADRVTRIEYADGLAEQFTYTGTKIDVATTRAGQTFDYDYDAMGRQSKLTLGDGTATSYTYTPTGLRDIVAGPRDSVDYDYDVFGRVTRVVRGDGSAVVYGYDANGNRTSVATADGTTTYTYDAADRMTSITDPRGRITTYTYNAFGLADTIDYPNGVTTKHTYDASANIVETRTTAADGSVIFGEQYRRDALANVEEIVRHDGTSVTFAYDALARLTSETHKGADGSVQRSIAYTYDAVGNRGTVTDSAAAAAVTYAYDGEKLQSDGQRTFTYDDNGDVRTVTGGASDVAYEYDAHRHLTKVTSGAASSTSFVYDAEGRRIRFVLASGATTHYVVDTAAEHARVLAEQNASRTTVATYTYGHDIVSMEREGKAYYYVLDGHGSVRALVDEQGNVTDRYTFTAFGQFASRSGTTVNPFAFAGEQFDAETGLYFLRARYYDPSIGRFTQRDTYAGDEEQPQTLNRYAYAVNNPVNVVDPSGRVGQGNAEHRSIGRVYILRHGDYFFSRLGRRINKGFTVPLLDGWGAFDRSIRGMPTGNKRRRGGIGSKPDLRHYATGEVHEIKPLNVDGWFDAPRQADSYARSLNKYESDRYFPGEGLPYWRAGNSWRTWPPVMPLGTKLHTYGPPFTPDGAILYSDNWKEDVRMLSKALSTIKGRVARAINGLRGMRLVRMAPSIIMKHNAQRLEQQRVAAMSWPSSVMMFVP